MADSPRIEELKRRVQLDPASIAFAALAEEYRRAERYQEAIDTCTAGLVRHPSYLSARVTLGRALMEVGRLQEAQQELEFVLNLAPENLAAIRGLAEIHHRLGDDREHQSAAAAVAEAPRAQPVRPEAPPPISVAEVQAAAGVVPPLQTPAPPDAGQPLMDRQDQAAVGRPLIAGHDAAVAPGPQRDELAPLEQFLAAIQRARAARSASR